MFSEFFLSRCYQVTQVCWKFSVVSFIWCVWIWRCKCRVECVICRILCLCCLTVMLELVIKQLIHMYFHSMVCISSWQNVEFLSLVKLCQQSNIVRLWSNHNDFICWLGYVGDVVKLANGVIWCSSKSIVLTWFYQFQELKTCKNKCLVLCCSCYWKHFHAVR